VGFQSAQKLTVSLISIDSLLFSHITATSIQQDDHHFLVEVEIRGENGNREIAEVLGSKVNASQAIVALFLPHINHSTRASVLKPSTQLL
jgi:hypothetical protein